MAFYVQCAVEVNNLCGVRVAFAAGHHDEKLASS